LVSKIDDRWYSAQGFGWKLNFTDFFMLISPNLNFSIWSGVTWRPTQPK
jgi:hypothetical protein